MPYPATARRDMLYAGKRLAKREAAMRSAIHTHQPAAICVSACIDFFRDAVELECGDRIEEVADFLDDHDIEHGLDGRTMDLVFENGAISDAVVTELVRLFDEDPAFRNAMTAQGWDTSVDLWRSPPEPEFPLAHAFVTSPQGDLFAAYL